MRELPSVQRIIEEARQAKSSGQLEASIRLSTRAIRLHKDSESLYPKGTYFSLCAALVECARYDEALLWANEALQQQPRDFALTNLLGVVQRRLGRFDEALITLRQAAKLDPKSLSPLVNMGNVYLDQHAGPKAVEIFSRVVRQTPRSGEYQRLLGRAYHFSGDLKRAKRQLELARQLTPNDPEAWIQLADLLDDTGDTDAAQDVLDRAMARLGPVERLIRAKSALLRRSGRHEAALSWLKEQVATQPDNPLLHLQLARTLEPSNREQANVAYSQALRLAPDHPEILAAYAESLDRTRGADEGKNIAAAYELARKRMLLGGNLLPSAKTLRNVLIRNADYTAAERIANFENLGEYWSKVGEEAPLHHLMGQVKTPAQRRQLLGWHRTWGRPIETLAARTPLQRPMAIAPRVKIRVGLMSSDLRNHPVAYFAAPLVFGLDRQRFEVFCYSWNAQRADPIQERFAQSADTFRLAPKIADREAAQLIADDQLDILIELGGSTDMNKIRTMAWRPAPRQASWLGYPHSAGLEAIDRIVTDPFITPPDPGLLLEKPLELAHSWVAFDRPGFGAIPDINPLTPEEREGRITFGTMNNPYKYNREVISAWAAVLSKVPDSRFLFVRPEGAVPSFRANIESLFASHGIEAARIGYVPVRGEHLVHYNAIDVALDTFPQTGGTTTCETLYMGVPVVTLVGEAFFERLSYSNLNNAGLANSAHIPWRSMSRRRSRSVATQLGGESCGELCGSN